MPTALLKFCVPDPEFLDQAGNAEEGKNLPEEPESTLHVLSLHL